MKETRHAAVIITLVFLLLVGLKANAQTPDGNTKHFVKDGLVFDYPSAWTLDDQSNGEAQQLQLERSGSVAEIRLFVHRARMDSPDKMAQARRTLIDPYVASVNDIFVQMGAKPEQTPASTQIGGAQAEGVRLRAALSGEPGEADIYWLAVGNRVVVLTFFGPDPALKEATPAWDIVRNSLRVETAATPGQKPPPK